MVLDSVGCVGQGMNVALIQIHTPTCSGLLTWLQLHVVQASGLKAGST